MGSIAAGLPDSDWARHKHAIWQMYIVSEMPLKDLLPEVQKLGLSVTEKQLIYQLKKWEFRRNIEKTTWNALESVIRKRKNDLGKESDVIHNTKRLKPVTVTRGISRAREYRLTIEQVLKAFPQPGSSSAEIGNDPALPPDSTVLSDLSLVVCTPAPLSLEFHWPQSLPWSRFQETYSSYFSGHVSQHYNKLASPENFVIRLRNNIASALSVTNNVQQPNMSLSRLAASMGVSFPECFPGEHVYRARALVDPPTPETVLHEFLKIVIYQISNNLPLFQDGQSDHRRWEYTVQVLQQSGLMKQHLNVSTSNDVTVLAFTENFFRTAASRAVTTRTQSKCQMAQSIVDWLLACGHNPDSPVPLTTAEGTLMVTAVQIAVASRDLDLLKILLDGGSSPNLTLSNSVPRPLRLAVATESRKLFNTRYRRPSHLSMDTDIEIISLLLSRGTPVEDSAENSQESIPALAVGFCDPAFVIQLLERGGDFDQSVKSKTGLVYDSTILSRAAGLPHPSHALNMVKTLVTWITTQDSDPSASISRWLSPDVFIAAAQKKNFGVIQYLSAFSPGMAILPNQLGLCAIHAAAISRSLLTCQAVWDHGPPGNVWSGSISPLHIASGIGARHLVDFFLANGAPINAYANTDAEAYRRILGSIPLAGFRGQPMTALQFALTAGVSRCALHLLEKGAVCLGTEVELAIRYCGDIHVLREVLRAVEKSGHHGISLTASAIGLLLRNAQCINRIPKAHAFLLAQWQCVLGMVGPT